MRRFIGEALGASSDVTAISGCARAYMRLSTGPPFDLVLVDYGVSPTRTGHGACVELVSRMFHRWPWMPIVIIADRRRVGRLAAELLVSGVRKVLPHGTATAVLARSVARAARRPGARVPDANSVATIKRSFVFLDEHADEVLSLRELAAMARMSRSHFSRTFHAVAGMPLRDYIRDLRLRRAHRLLVSSKLSLTAVAVESGFYDLPHFDKVCRQRLGMSPQEFRGRYAALRLDA